MGLRLADIRPGERRDVLCSFLTLFALMAGHALLETARDSLFLAKLSSQRLPFVYIGIALIALLISEGRHHVRRPPRGPGWGFAAPSFIAALVTFGFWGWLSGGGSQAVYALYLWSGLLATLLVVQFWTLAGDIFTIRQAKRLFATLGTGGILGAVAGSFFAQQITQGAGPERLLPTASAFFLFAGVASLGVLGESRRKESSEKTRSSSSDPDSLRISSADLGATFRSVVRHPYMRRVAGLVLVSAITVTLADFIFKAAVESAVPASQLGYVFASFYLVVNTLSLIAQLSIVGWMTRNMSIHRVLAFLPAILLIASGGFLVAAIAMGVAAAWLFRPIHAAFLLKAADGTFRHSVHRTLTEVLYVPLSAAWRARIKSFVDVVGQRGGQAIASLAYLGLAAAGAPDAVLGGILVLLCASWLWIAIGIRRPYVNLFRSALAEGAVRTRIELPDLDLGSLEALIAALSSPNDLEVQAALDMLAETERTHLIPALILYHPSADVVARALGLFENAGRSDHHPLLERLTEHSAANVRAAAIASIPCALSGCTDLLHGLDDEDSRVRAAAVVRMLSTDGLPSADTARAQSVLDAVVREGSLDARRALARAIERQPHPTFDDTLMALAQSADVEVNTEVARAMQATPNPNHLASLVPMLAHRESRGEARSALVAMGAPAFRHLSALLHAPHEESADLSVLRHLPRTLSRFPARDAVPVLLQALSQPGDDMVSYKVLRALGQLCDRERDFVIKPKFLDPLINDALRQTLLFLDWKIRLRRAAMADPSTATPVCRLVSDSLQHKEESALERLFRLLGLRYRGEDFGRIWRGLRGDRGPQASSRELLENTLQSPQRDAVLALVDDLPDHRRLAAGARWHTPSTASTQNLFRELLQRSDIHLRVLVAYHVGELGMTDLRDDITQMLARAPDPMREALEETLLMLDNPNYERTFVAPQV